VLSLARSLPQKLTGKKVGPSGRMVLCFRLRHGSFMGFDAVAE
jgi:hypothetical protein